MKSDEPHHIVYLDTTSIVKRIDETKKAMDAYAILERSATTGHLQCYTSFFSIMEALDQVKYDEYIRENIRESTDTPRSIVQNYKQDRRLSGRALRLARNKIEAWVSQYTPKIVVVAELDFKDFLMKADPLLLPLTVALHSSIFAPDAIHFSYALLLDCDILLTDDSQFSSEINRAMSDPKSPLRKQTFRLLGSMTGVEHPQKKKSGKLNIPIRAQSFKSFIRAAKGW